MSDATTAGFPPELDLFVDFVTDDDRPTFILEQSQSSHPRIVLCNAALEALLTHSARGFDGLLAWVDTLGFVVQDKAARLADVGTFAHKHWSRKRIGDRWIVVFCKQHDAVYASEQLGGAISHDPETPDTPLAEQLHLSDSEPLEMDGTAYSTNTSVSQRDLSRDSDMKLEEYRVDWLKWPQLTPDPYVHFLANYPWHQTTIGPMHTWHPALHQLFVTIQSSMEPRIIYWGSDLCMMYNEAAILTLGTMHPRALGQPMGHVWGDEMRVELTEILLIGMKRGRAVHNRNRELVIIRDGPPESAFFDWVFVPVPSTDGRFLGFVNEFREITPTVVQNNRHEATREVLQNASKAPDLDGLWLGLLKALEDKSMDVSYALIYRPDTVEQPSRPPPPDVPPPRLRATFGIEGVTLGSVPVPALAKILQDLPEDVVVLQEVESTLPRELAVVVRDVGVVRTVCILPVTGIDSNGPIVVVLGMSPIRPFDQSSRQFVTTLRDMLFKSASLFSLPLEQRRLQGIAAALSQQLRSVTAKAEKSEEDFTRMVQEAPIGMCMHRPDGQPVYVNDAYLEILGTTRDAFYQAADTGYAWQDSIFDEDLENVNEFFRTAIATAKPGQVEFRVWSGSSPRKFHWVEATTVSHLDPDGNVLFLYGWLTDISSRKLTESMITERLQDALETKRSSENFIDMVSHEIRNPLSSILQLADSIMMSLPEDTEAATLSKDARATLVDAAQTITLCAKHQKNIIDEVLTFSKLDSKLLILSLDRVRPQAIVESALKMAKAELEHAGINGHVNVHPSYKSLSVDYVLLDPGRLLQVMINLLTNAIKFTQGSQTRNITIDLAAFETRPTDHDCKVTFIAPRRHDPADDVNARTVSSYKGAVEGDVFLHFSVKDTGCGLTGEEMTHLFHRFSQASPKTYKQYGGSGLGLFISRELTEMQGGQIGVRSEAGSGSEFAFYIKTSRVPAPHMSAISSSSAIPAPQNVLSSPELNGRETRRTPSVGTNDATAQPMPAVEDLHVLVVEDNAINQKVMSQQLRKAGCAAVHVMDHGLDALSFLATTSFQVSSSSPSTAAAPPVPLSVILLDVEMPVMDGLTCARAIRDMQAEGSVRNHVPIIGITANARMEQVSSCIEAGMDEVITKPFRMAQLIPRMQNLTGKYATAVT